MAHSRGFASHVSPKLAKKKNNYINFRRRNAINDNDGIIVVRRAQTKDIIQRI